nr:hypothetical protein [Tanacetum cinerariifolium]
MVESVKVEYEKATEKIYRKLLVTGIWLRMFWRKQEKQTRDDVDLVDVDDVDLYYALYLKNRVTKLEEDFTRLLKAKKAKEAKKAGNKELKVNKEVVDLSSDEDFFGDEDVVCFNDIKYHLSDAEIRMFKETPTTSRGPRRQLASTYTSNRAPIASTKNQDLDVYLLYLLLMLLMLHRLFLYKKEVQALAIPYPLLCMLMMYLYVDVLDTFGLLILCFVLSLSMYVDA